MAPGDSSMPAGRIGSLSRQPARKNACHGGSRAVVLHGRRPEPARRRAARGLRWLAAPSLACGALGGAAQDAGERRRAEVLLVGIPRLTRYTQALAAPTTETVERFYRDFGLTAEGKAAEGRRLQGGPSAASASSSGSRPARRSVSRGPSPASSSAPGRSGGRSPGKTRPRSAAPHFLSRLGLVWHCALRIM
jgi:hypothetical protein